MNFFPNPPLVLPYMGVSPIQMGHALRGDAGSAILGRVTIGRDAVLGPFAVLRADGHVINVGNRFYIGEHSTVHIAHAVYGTSIGDDVTVGANVVVHGCVVGDDCVIQDHVSVLDGAVIGNGCVIAHDSIVFPRTVMRPGQWCEGTPAVAVRPVTAAERSELHNSTRMSTTNSQIIAPHASCASTTEPEAGAYVAATVTGNGELRMGDMSSLWHGCVVDAPVYGVTLGARSNVQDNSLLRASKQAIMIGDGCTVGHNVLLKDCTIGARALIGMGSTLAAGTVVMDDVLVAAGSITTYGQVLESGWLWGGRPARPMSRLDDRKYQIIRESAVIYCEYAREFGKAHKSALPSPPQQ